MKKVFFWLGWAILNACHPAVDASTAYNVAGIYQLVGYTTPTISDDNPNGTVSAALIDEQHISLVVKGTSGKTKISYSYANVLVSTTGQTSPGRDSYRLLYKGRQIGVASNDAISRYINVSPSSGIQLTSIEL